MFNSLDIYNSYITNNHFILSPTHRENNSDVFLIDPNLHCDCAFPIDLTPSEIRLSPEQLESVYSPESLK